MYGETADVYILRSKNHFFLTSVTKSPEYDGKIECTIKCKSIPYDKKNAADDPDYEIYVETRDCLTLRFHIDSSTGSSVDKKSYLAYIQSMENCSMDGKLKRGGGMTELVTCHLALCSDLFGVVQYNLLDLSTVKCGDIKIGLGDYGMLVQGKTWYQRTLNAVPLYDDQQSFLDQYPIKLRQIFSYEDSELLKDAMIETDIPIPDREKYSSILTDSAEEGYTWQYTISRIDSNKSGCSFFEGRVVSAILTTLGLKRVSDYKVMYDDFIKNSLIGYTKIE